LEQNGLNISHNSQGNTTSFQSGLAVRAHRSLIVFHHLWEAKGQEGL